MNILTFVILVFSILGSKDYLFSSKLGIGEEFERGFMMLGTLALAMIGMIVVAPLIASLLKPFFDFAYTSFRIDPSIIPASLFANDMGGAPLAREIAKNEKIELCNALVVSSMLGCTISFTIPFAMSTVKKKRAASPLSHTNNIQT